MIKKILTTLILMNAMIGCTNGSSGGSGDNNNKQKPKSNINSKISKSGSDALTGQSALLEVGNSITKSKQNSANSSVHTNYFDSRNSSFSINPSLILNSYINKVLNKSSNQNQNQISKEKDEVKSKANLLSQSLESQNCKTEFMDLSQNANQHSGSNNSSSASAQFMPAILKISGSGCPMEMTFKISMEGIGTNVCNQSEQNQEQCKFKALIKLAYRVLDEKMAEDIGLRSGHLNMSFEIDQSFSMPTSGVKNGAGVGGLPPGSSELPPEFGGGGMPPGGGVGMPMQMDMAIISKIQFDLKVTDLDGNPHLVSGSEDVNMKMAGMDQTGYFKEDLKYLSEANNVSSVLTANVKANGTKSDEKFYVDGESVTFKVYESERSKFANSFMPLFGQINEDENENSNSNETSDDEYNNGYNQGNYKGGANPIPTPTFAPVPLPIIDDSIKNDFSLWMCVTENIRTQELFVGYGKGEFIAKSESFIQCQKGEQNTANCNSTVKLCELLKSNTSNWFCINKNSKTNKLYSSYGRSENEASLLATKSCYTDSESGARAYCQSHFQLECSQIK